LADLYILLPAQQGQPPVFAWRASGDWHVGAARPDGRGGRGENAVAFVPGTAVTLHKADVIAKKPVEARRTALFAIEDDVAEPIEALHAALGPAGDGLARSVYLTSLADMTIWLQLLEDLGLPDAAIVPTYSLLPDESMAVQGANEYVFREGADAFSIDASAPDDLVRSIAPGETKTVYGAALARILGQPPAHDGFAEAGEWLMQLAHWHQQHPAAGLVSLRQGDFAVRHALKFDGLSRWRPVAALAAACFALWVTSVWFETSALRETATDLRARTSDILAAAVPESQGNVNQGLAVLREDQRLSSNSLRPTLASAALYEALGPTGNAEIRSLRFDAGTGRLTAVVVFDNYSDSDAIGERLEEAGLSVSLGEARQSGNRVLGEFTIEAAS